MSNQARDASCTIHAAHYSVFSAHQSELGQFPCITTTYIDAQRRVHVVRITRHRPSACVAASNSVSSSLAGTYTAGVLRGDDGGARQNGNEEEREARHRERGWKRVEKTSRTTELGGLQIGSTLDCILAATLTSASATQCIVNKLLYQYV
jgi:hypothetical protein